MGEQTFKRPEFVSYPELFQILNKKFNATHDEIRYWIRCDFNSIESEVPALFPFLSDIPTTDGGYPVPEGNFFQPSFYFFLIEDVHNYYPIPLTRFVYRMNLTARECWSIDFLRDANVKNMNILERAQRCGILRCYDKEMDDFTFFKTFKSGDKESRRLWADTDEGISILNDPESFFLLEDILRIERAFFNRPREDCLKELEINVTLPNLKVVSLNSNVED